MFFKSLKYITSYIIAILLSQNIILAQDTISQKKVALNGYVKGMNTIIFADADKDWITASLIHNRLNFKWFASENLKVGIEMRNRFFYGEFLKYVPNYDSSLKSDDGWVHLSRNVALGKSYVLNSAFDRGFIEYSHNKLQVTLGRQRINWGQTFVWNPNDIFNAYSYLDFDYEKKPGSDALRLQYYTSSVSTAEVAVKASKGGKITTAGLYRFNKWNYDFQALGGIWNEADYVIGLGWSGQIIKGGFRGELSYFQPKNNFIDTSGVLIASIGYDYTFKNSLMLQFETIYNGNNTSEINLNLAESENSISPKNPFLSGYSFFLGASYPFTPLLSGSISGIVNKENKLLFVIPNITYSLSNDLDFSIVAQMFKFFNSGQPGNKGNYIFMRLKYSF